MKELLQMDPNERIKADQALASTWLNRRFAATTRGPLKEEEANARLAMLKYAGYTKLKKIVRKFIVTILENGYLIVGFLCCSRL